MRSGAATWSLNGRTTGIPFPGLSEEDRKAGYVYMTALPSVFLVGHVDYVRVVRLLPLGPERTELRIEYLFSPQTLADPNFDMPNVVDFTNSVMTEGSAESASSISKVCTRRPTCAAWSCPRNTSSASSMSGFALNWRAFKAIAALQPR